MPELPKALTRSETKGKLLKHLKMSEEAYTLLAKEADVIYKELVGDVRNLKPSRTNIQPPYDWNDICEKAREAAVRKLGQGTNSTTAYWWRLGSRELSGLPWLPVFILYKTFRHRDGRAKSRQQESPPQYASSPVTQQYGTYQAYSSEGTSAAMQGPADSLGASDGSSRHRGYYDPVREGYRDR